MGFKKRTLIIGVTGSLATGKTAVSRMLKELGAYVIDADKIVHSLLNQTVRKKIRGFVFDDQESLDKLCKIIHPIVKREIRRKIRDNKSKKIIVIDAPLLIESGFHKKCDKLIVVKSGLSKQLERAKRGLGLSIVESLKRIKLQMPLKEKIRLADFIIDNNGSLKQTKKRVEKVMETLRGSLRRRSIWKK